MNKTSTQVLKLYQQPYDFNAIYTWAKNFMESDISSDDIQGFVAAIAELATPLKPNMDLSKTVDISGTGGDGIKTINVGTVASFVMAAGGLVVGKQSTRGYTGVLGSKDFLAELGIEVKRENEDVAHIAKLLEQLHLGFYSHTAFNANFSNQVRFFGELKEKNLAFVTPWHLLFWVFNPLPLSYRVYGMFTDKYLSEVAEALRRQGVKRGWVVHGAGGTDEVSILGPTKVAEFSASGIRRFEVKPADFGVPKGKLADIEVTDAPDAVAKATAVLRGEQIGALRDLVAVNAAAGFYIAGLATGLEEAIQLAIDILNTRKAWNKFEEYRYAAGSPHGTS